MNPFRPYFFWDQNVQEGTRSRQKIQNFGRIITEAYRANKFNLPTNDSIHDKTIMSHLMKHDYPSEEHRISDIVVFLIAGESMIQSNQ